MVVRTTAGSQAIDQLDSVPAVQLSSDDVRQRLRLVRTGLLGSGATAHVYACVWPDRFGETKLLAAKVIGAAWVVGSWPLDDQAWRGLDCHEDGRNSACTFCQSVNAQIRVQLSSMMGKVEEHLKAMLTRLE
jgi:hypothetical protein